MSIEKAKLLIKEINDNMDEDFELNFLCHCHYLENSICISFGWKKRYSCVSLWQTRSKKDHSLCINVSLDNFNLKNIRDLVLEVEDHGSFVKPKSVEALDSMIERELLLKEITSNIVSKNKNKI